MLDRFSTPKGRQSAKPIGAGIKVDQRSDRARVGTRQDARQDSGLRHGRKRRSGVGGGQKLAHLGTDTLFRNRL
jgi:hypothetical protein